MVALPALLELLPPGPLGAALFFGAWALVSLAVVLVFQRVIVARAHATPSKLDDAVVEALRVPLYLGLLLAGLWILTTNFSVVPDAWTGTVQFALAAAVALTAATALVRVAMSVLDALAQSQPKLRAVKGTVRFATRFVAYAIAFVLILDHAGVDVTPILGALGIGGLAVALALQDTLANFFAGLYLRLDRPLREGDFVELEGGAVRGWVQELGWRSVRVRDAGGNRFVLPNSRVSSGLIRTNLASMQLALTVTYDSDLEQVERAALAAGRDALATMNGHAHGQPSVLFQGFTDQGVALTLTIPAARDSDQPALQHACVKALVARFAREGITFRFLPAAIEPKGRRGGAVEAQGRAG